MQLICEAQLFYEFNDGSKSTKSSAVKSSGYYFGIEAVVSLTFEYNCGTYGT